MAVSHSNIPQHEALRWSIDVASTEFRVSRMTLRKYLAGIGARPDTSGCFSTIQLVEALYGDLYVERIRLTRTQRRKVALANAITTGSVVDRRLLMVGLTAIADAMVSRIRASSLDRLTQDDLLKDLASVGTVLEGVVREQSRLPRGRQYDGDGEDDEDDFDAEDEDDVPRTGKVPKRHFRRRPGFKAQKTTTA
jgi:hypothetical protein